MGRTVYHVTYRENSSKYDWYVTKNNASRASSRHLKKSAAVRKAKSLAKNMKPSQVVVHTKNGGISYENTYGNDPVRYEN